MLSVGTHPPEFTLLDQQEQTVAWSSLRGRPVVVFCYPKANTPGCTQEACEFRDLAAAFGALGVAVVGLSADAPKAQKRFADKHQLVYPLLSDPDHVVLSAWGVWGSKKLYGRVFDGIIRTTVLFGADGEVLQVWSPVKLKGHVDAVLAAAQALKAR